MLAYKNQKFYLLFTQYETEVNRLKIKTKLNVIYSIIRMIVNDQCV